MVEIHCPYCEQSHERSDLVHKAIADAVREETFECGAPTDSGTCSREVDKPGDRCWQHVEDDSNG